MPISRFPWDRPRAGPYNPRLDSVFGPEDDDSPPPMPIWPKTPGLDRTGIPPYSTQPVNPPKFGPDSPFFEGFESTPEGQLANVMGRLDPNLSSGTFNFARNTFAPSLVNRYKQQGASQILGGAQQAGTFSDFLDKFNFNRALRREMPQSSRFNVSPARYNY